MVNGTSKLTGAPFVCNKCGNKDNKQLILDEKTGDTICNGSDGIGCGNIINDHEVDHGANKRHFADDTEDEFGLPIRTFNSFRSAAAEAAISRLYGGIHFRDAITAGEWQGKQVGALAAQRFSKHLTHFK
jgi:hypothetical protein